MKKNTTHSFNDYIVDWYDKHGRKNLPWQGNNSYHVWLSEVMLQQTQVIKVIDYFNNFLSHFPSLQSLAQAKVEDVLACWSGLGYYNRAKNLHKTAQICLNQHNGKLPITLKQLMELPGIGQTTAGAILSLASDLSYPILDGNVKRVISRAFTIKEEKLSVLNAKLWTIVTKLMPKDNCRKYNQALMDIGSLICTRSNPNCQKCPLIKTCKARENDTISLYPQANKKTKQIKKKYYLLLLKNKNKVLLKQRDSNNIWPQLWFLPAYNSKEEMFSTNLIDLEDSSKAFEYTIDHILSHRKLELKIFNFPLDLKNTKKYTSEYNWVDVSEYKNLPHPTALVKIMDYLLAQE